MNCKRKPACNTRLLSNYGWRVWVLCILVMGVIQAVQGNSAQAPVIDERIAAELGLVGGLTPAPANNPSSTVRDIWLNVGKRKELVFPEQVTLNIKDQALPKFTILNVNNSLFIEANEALSAPVIAIAVLKQSQESIVLNLMTTEKPIIQDTDWIHGQLKPVVNQPEPAQPAIQIPVPGRRQSKGYEYDDYVVLAAFAARLAYAPDRLIDPPPGVREVNLEGGLKASKALPNVQHLMRVNQVTVTPLSSWAYKELHITILELKNTGPSVIRLAPEMIRGPFIAKSYYRHVLGTTPRDQYSALFLISKRPFVDVLEAL